MTYFSDDVFDAALASLEDRLMDLITQPKDEGDPPEKWSKAMSALMKAKTDLLAQREAEAAKAFEEKYTRYEDMPPPTPEDEKRFYARFEKLVKSIAESEEDEASL